MKFLVTLVAVVTVFAGVLMVGCAAYGPPRTKGEQIYRRIVFASPNGRDLRLDLYIPPKSIKPAPVVVWIFGGSWKFGNRAYHLNVRNLTRSGIAVAAIDYRLSGEAIYPAQLEDCRVAVDWLRVNGARYGLDPTRIGLAGESSGGHLAALLGTREGRSRIRAVFALYPPTDLVALGRQYAEANPSDIERLLGGPIEKRLVLAREASPLNHVRKESPPFLLIHGARDTLVPLAHSQWLDRRLQEEGVESRLIIVPERTHWFALDPSQLAEVSDFFLRHFESTQ
jgi:acetyl esterase/lipase